MRKLKYIAFLLAIIVSLSCGNQIDLEYENFGYCKILIPKNWVSTNQKSYDSYVNVLTDKKDTLIIEYGKFTSEFKEFNSMEEQFDLVNGYFVQKITSRIGISGIYIGENNEGFSMKITYLSKDTNSNLFQKIYSSLKFNVNCLSECNPSMIGKIIYKRECLHCHGDIKDGFDAIILSDLIKKKDNKWLMNWISNKSFRKNNQTKAYNSFGGLNGMECDIKIYQNQELKSIVSYLRLIR